LKTICILPSLEQLDEHRFSDANVGTLRIHRESELGQIGKGHFKGCSVMSAGNTRRPWRLAGGRVFIVPWVDMIGY
jgi:hypothetical protein